MSFRTLKRTCPCCHLDRSAVFHLQTDFSTLALNTYPGDDSWKRIRTETDAAEARVRKLNNAIKRLTAQRDYLTRVVIASRRSVLAPIARVPDDILLQIFGFYLQTQTSPRGWKTTNNQLHPTPFTLAMVSRRWRSLTLSCQYLWSIDPQNSAYIASSPASVAESRLALQLQRSGETPLSVDLTGSPSWYYLDSPGIERLILRQTYRWQELNLMEPYIFVALKKQSTTFSFPALRTLIMPEVLSHVCLEVGGNSDPIPIFTPSTAPLLEDVTLIHPYLHCEDNLSHSITHSSFPFLQLTRIAITLLNAYSFLPLTYLIAIVQRCTNLETLHFDITEGFYDDTADSDPNLEKTTVTLAKLRTIEINVPSNVVEVDSGLDIHAALGCLRLPALRCVRLRSPPIDVLLEAFSQLVQRSCCEIQELTLAQFHHDTTMIHPGLYSYTAFPSLLDGLKCLTRLTVQAIDIQFITEIFLVLAWNQEGSRHCPRLGWLTVQKRIESWATMVDSDGLDHGADEVDHKALLMKCLPHALDFTLSRIHYPQPRQHEPTTHLHQVTFYGFDVLRLARACLPSIDDLSDAGRTKFSEAMGDSAGLLIEMFEQGKKRERDSIEAIRGCILRSSNIARGAIHA